MDKQSIARKTMQSQAAWGVHPAGGEYGVYVAGELVTYASDPDRAEAIYLETLRVRREHEQRSILVNCAGRTTVLMI